MSTLPINLHLPSKEIFAHVIFKWWMGTCLSFTCGVTSGKLYENYKSSIRDHNLFFSEPRSLALLALLPATHVASTLTSRWNGVKGHMGQRSRGQRLRSRGLKVIRPIKYMTGIMISFSANPAQGLYWLFFWGHMLPSYMNMYAWQQPEAVIDLAVIDSRQAGAVRKHIDGMKCLYNVIDLMKKIVTFAGWHITKIESKQWIWLIHVIME